mmetsp:Transcript_52249/g.140624  ORF Transcript_52249/g.140624 Transcript_52249/m.140624 type:complete len:416 (-) Transcript_52249:440-1687(-)
MAQAVLSWLAVGATVERELDDVCGIWATGIITSVRTNPSEVDLAYEDGLVEVGVPMAELRSRLGPCESQDLELATSPLSLKRASSTPLVIVPECPSLELVSTRSIGSMMVVSETSIAVPQGIGMMIRELRTNVHSLTQIVLDLKEQQVIQSGRMDIAIQETLEAKTAVDEWLCQRTDEGILIHQAHPHIDGRALYGHVLWYSGEALAKYLVWRHSGPASRDSCIGKVVLELGAGTGVVGLTLGRLGAAVTVTDAEPQVVALLKRKIAANDLEANVKARALSFGDASTYLEPRASLDLVVAADVLYEAGQGSVLARVLDAHVPIGSGTEVLLAYEHRPEAPLDFFAAAHELGFTLERLEDPQGNATAAARGHPGSATYRACCFVELPAARAREAVANACFSPGNQRRIQIFRLCRP